MTEGTKTLRLSKVAKEFNIGISTIVEHLNKKGFKVDNNPNSKISEEAYELLFKDFQKERNLKEATQKARMNVVKRETVSLDDDKKLAEEEQETEQPDDKEEVEEQSKDLFIKSSMDKPSVEEVKTEEIKLSGPKVIGKIDPDTIDTTKSKKKSDKKAEKKPDKKKEEEKKKKVEEKEVKEDSKADVSEIKDKPKDEVEKVSAEEKPSEKKPEKKIEEKVVKKEPEKDKEEPPVEKKPKEEAPEITLSDEIKIDEKVADQKKKDDDSSDVYKTEFKKLEGPTILGKIELPAKKDASKKPVASSSGDSQYKKRKRKRIKKEKTQETKPPEDKQKQKPEDKKTKTHKPPVKGKGKHHRKDIQKQEYSEEEISKQIRETLASLSGTKSKSKAAKYRRQKRDLLQQQKIKDQEMIDSTEKTLEVTEFISANELASLMDVNVTEVIKVCMSIGLFVSINQRLDAETITIVADEFGYEVSFVSVDDQEAVEEEQDDPAELEPRAPIVTVMGHVDHGKTSLLDYIRHSNIIAGESGGITQHIGAYAVELDNNKYITFLDTPGHEAFTAMRARGAKITDVAIIVVAADDSVMPQTKEAINHALAAGVPIIIAINKIDRPTANVDKVKEELASFNILVEDWGGKYQCQEISAKQGTNIGHLQEKVLLEAEMLDLKANPNKDASGTVIESMLDKGRGYVGTILVQNGTLKVGDMVVAGTNYGKVRAMFNERGMRIKEAGPSTPVLILGLNGAPQAGEKFNVINDEHEAKAIAQKRQQLVREQGLRTQKHITLDEIGRRIAIGDFKELNVIVKGDVDGSVEALSDSLLKLTTEEIQVNIIHKAVGPITEGDVLLASASNAVIIGFQVRPSLAARKLAEQEEIDIRIYSVIYNAINELKSAIEGMLSPAIEEKIKANLEVRDVFKITKVGSVAGCFVLDGKIHRNSDIRVIRDGIVVYTGKLGSLKRFKEDVKEVQSGYECGLNVENFNDIKVGDIIEAFETIEIARKLE